MAGETSNLVTLVPSFPYGMIALPIDLRLRQYPRDDLRGATRVQASAQPTVTGHRAAAAPQGGRSL